MSTRVHVIVWALIVGGLAIGASPAGAEVDPYQPAATMQPSQTFQVTAGGHPVFVERLPVEEGDLKYTGFPGDEDLNYHCARFAMDGPAQIRITSSEGTGDYRLRPLSAGLESTSDGSTVTFMLDRPRNLLFQVGTAWLYIFADPPETDAPRVDEAVPAEVRGDVPPFYIDPNMNKIVNVADYDVDPSGGELCTRELQKAIIDAAVGPYPGGVVYVPKGVYKTGTLRFYSGVTLYLAEGALLQGSKDPADYPLPFGVEGGSPNRDYGYDYALLKIHNCENVVIRGRGTVDSGGPEHGRLKICHVQNSRNVRVEDVVMRNTTGWMFPILDSQDVRVRNVRLFSPITANTDGINPDSSSNVTLDGNFIVSGDDSVAVKASRFGLRLRDEIRDIHVLNNVLLTMKSSLKIGTETQARLIHDIVFENNDILMADRAFTIYLRDGALVDRVVFRNNRVEMAGGLRNDNNRVIDLSISTRGDDIWRTPEFSYAEDHPGEVRYVLFENIDISTEESRDDLEPSEVEGYDEAHMIRDVVFRNVRVNGEPISDPGTMISVGDSGRKIPFMEVEAETTSGIVFE